jgi:hypothetical protein
VPAHPTAKALLQFVLASSLLFPAAGEGGPAERLRLVPHFTAGESLYYQFELHTSTAGRASGSIKDPEAASHLDQSVSVLVRLEVVSVEGENDRGPGRVRLRATYEKSAASSKSDALDTQQAALEEQYRKLEGHSIEFTIEPNGRLTDVQGLREVMPNEASAANAREMLAGISFGASMPREGVEMGKKWTTERPIPAAPLAGLVWRAESAYLRNEPCRSTAPVAATADEMCAVIVTRFLIVRRKAGKDPTPDDYRRNGLRTSGKWTGTGESLSSISLRTGLVTSATQTGDEEMDFTVTSNRSGSHMRYAGRVRTESNIALVPAPAAR